MAITRLNPEYAAKTLNNKIAYGSTWSALQIDGSSKQLRLEIQTNETVKLYKSTDNWATSTALDIMKFSVVRPTGSTAKAISENAEKNVFYQWQDFSSAGYSPTGANGNWVYRILDTYSQNRNYIVFEAYNTSTAKHYIYSYPNNSWSQV